MTRQYHNTTKGSGLFSLNRRTAISVLLVVIAAGGLGIWKWQPAARDDDNKPGTGQITKAGPRPQASPDDLVNAVAGISGAGDDSRQSLQDLRASLMEMPKNEAIAMIRGFLASGEDRATGLSFEIASDGSLIEWPTFRTFLLDVLPAIDPAAAAAIGREILASPTSADEWALALRNVARGEPLEESATFLQRKTEELITNPAWQADPSIGYLNAFDVLVHIGATGSTPLLSDLVQRKDRKDLSHAAFLTIDRLVQRQPVDLLDRLAADRALQESRPEMVAQQFARADVRDPGQRQILMAWLLDPARTSLELRSFAGVYPNNNRFVSNNLLTVESTQSGDDLAAHDHAALQAVSAWAGDPAFEPVREHLAVMLSRLEGFVSVRDNPTPPDIPPTK
jgi:hypothetical protein